MVAEDGETHRAPNRRLLLASCGLGVAGVVAGVSGCGASTRADPPTSGDAGGNGGPGSAGTVLGAAADVPVGGGRVFDSLEVVVTQPEAGRFLGFSSVCTHTGCNVTEVVAGSINCPCHGSRYHLDGSVERGPAPRALPSRPVRVADGQIVLT